MARNFYFGSDATMASGSASFSALINSDPEAFGISEAQAVAYGEIDAALQSAVRAATTPQTRTVVSVAEKNRLMKAMQRSASDLSGIIHATPTVNDAQLISLGLLPRSSGTRRHVPETPPIVRVISVAGRVVNIRVCDKDSPSSRSKPFGATGWHLYSYVGEEATTDRARFTSKASSAARRRESHFPTTSATAQPSG